MDHHDRMWYSHYYGYAVNKWQTKMLISMMDVVVCNSFTVYSEDHDMDFTTFRLELADWAMHHK